jgi:hypothetical protein
VRALGFLRQRGRMIALTGREHLFWTTSSGKAGKASALTVHARAVDASGRARVVGRLVPGMAKAKVVVSWRPEASKQWRAQVVLTGKKGVVHATAPSPGGRWHVVMQWLGNRAFRGAGSKPIHWP